MHFANTPLDLGPIGCAGVVIEDHSGSSKGQPRVFSKRTMVIGKARRRGRRSRIAAVGALIFAFAGFPVTPTRADEGGLSFWLPGLYGSLAATPVEPGWSFQSVYIHTKVDAGGGKVFPRGGRLEAGVRGHANLVAMGPSRVFASPVFGAQMALSVLAVAGQNRAEISATVTGPRGNTISGRRDDERTAFGDLLPMISLKWNRGVHNFMTYATGNIPIGAYDPQRLSNLGLGHGAIDAGGGYTYFSPVTGHEFSVATGFTYNFKNDSTDYRNGVDWHLDWGASQFLSQHLHVGLVGYLYQQVGGDSGAGATLGNFKSRVAGIGPQVGVLFPIFGMQGYVNLKGYKEFAAENRPEGWNLWLALAISPAPPK
jgi:hypothetical protein